jgi:hypothetical protein
MSNVNLFIGKIIIGDRSHHGATDILLAEFPLITGHALAVSLARINTSSCLEALRKGTRKCATNHGKKRDSKKKNKKQSQ